MPAALFLGLLVLALAVSNRSHAATSVATAGDSLAVGVGSVAPSTWLKLGRTGTRAAQWLAQGWWADALARVGRSGVLVASLGTNDIRAGARGVELAAVLSNLQEAADNAGVRVVWVSVANKYDTLPAFAVLGLPHIRIAGALTPDGVHLTVAGYRTAASEAMRRV